MKGEAETQRAVSLTAQDGAPNASARGSSSCDGPRLAQRIPDLIGQGETGSLNLSVFVIR